MTAQFTDNPLAIAIGYVRVSTEGQANEGVSLDAQKARIEAWAIANGRKLEHIYTDAGLSGGRADKSARAEIRLPVESPGPTPPSPPHPA